MGKSFSCLILLWRKTLQWILFVKCFSIILPGAFHVEAQIGLDEEPYYYRFAKIVQVLSDPTLRQIVSSQLLWEQEGGIKLFFKKETIPIETGGKLSQWNACVWVLHSVPQNMPRTPYWRPVKKKNSISLWHLKVCVTMKHQIVLHGNLYDSYPIYLLVFQVEVMMPLPFSSPVIHTLQSLVFFSFAALISVSCR